MSAQGRPEVGCGQQDHCVEIMQHVPDQNGHVRKLYYHTRRSSVQDFLEKCGFGDGPLELFSCVTCFAGDMAWDGLAHSKYNVDLWNKALDTYACKHGLVAIPAVIMKEL